MSNLSTIEQEDSAGIFRGKLNSVFTTVGEISTLSDSDGASTVIERVNSVITKINQGDVTPTDPDDPVVLDSNRILNILCIGNSLTEDAWAYVPYMLLEYGIRVRMMIFRKSSAAISDLKDHYCEPWGYPKAGEIWDANLNGKMLFIDTSGETLDDNNNSAATWKIVSKEEDTEIFRNFSGEWSYYTQSDYCVQDAVKWRDIEWDLITVQDFEGSSFAPVTSALNTLLSYIKQDLSHDTCLFGLQVSPTYPNNGAEYYHSGAFIARNKIMYDSCPLDLVIPNCTAIANARQLSEYKNYGHTNNLTAEGIHLNEGLPCYISALTSMEALFRRFYPWLTIDGDLSRPSSTWVSGKAIPNAQSTSYGIEAVTNENAPMCQRFALLANDYPWQIMDEDFIRNEETATVLLRYNVSNATLKVCLPSSVNPISVKKHSHIFGFITPTTGFNAVSYTMTVGGTWENNAYVSGGVEYSLPTINGIPYFNIPEIKENTLIKVTAEQI